MPGSLKHPIPLVQLALEKYCEWREANAKANNEDYTLQPSDFFTGYGYSVIEFMKTYAGKTYAGEYDDALIVMTVNNGDEGGGARLFVEFLQDRVLNMTQTFDMAIGVIVSDGQLVNIEGY